MKRAGAAHEPHPLSARAASSSSTASGRASAPGTSCSRARMSRRSGAARHLRRRHRAPALCARPRLRRPLFPADPSDRPHQPQGQEQQPDAPARTIPAAPMRSARRRAATTPSTPSSARFEDFARLVAAAARARARDRARLRHPVLARPSLDQGASGVVRLAAGRHASNSPRTRRRNTRTSSTSTSTATPSRRSGTRCATSCCSGSAQGVKIFRVDNPHTKPLPFWEWMIGEVQRPASRRDLPRRGLHAAEDDEAARQGRLHPVLHLLHLAQHQGGADRVSDRADARPNAAHYMRPNFFVNTPDINPSILQTSGRAGFQSRAGARGDARRHYGIYSGFELCEATPVPGKEEYLNSEKYEIKAWDWDRPGNIRRDIALLNRLRREHPALQDFRNLTLLQRLERQHPLLRQDDAGEGQLPPVRGQPRSAQRAGRALRGAAVGVRPAGRGLDRGRGSVTGSRFTWHGKIQHMLARSRAERPYRDLAPQPAGRGALMQTLNGRTAPDAVERSDRDSRSRRSIAATRDWYKDASSTSCTSRRSSTPTTTASATSTG